MVALGRPAPALALTTMVTSSLPADARPDQTLPIVRGTLLLQGAVAAARMADIATTRNLLASAEAVAARPGPDIGRYWTRFGTTVVELTRARTAVELGDGPTAITVHHRLRQVRLNRLPRRLQAGHFLTVARAYLQTGAIDEADKAWERSTHLAPAETRSPLHQEIHHQIRTR
jgi:hypothetical protein